MWEPWDATTTILRPRSPCAITQRQRTQALGSCVLPAKTHGSVGPVWGDSNWVTTQRMIPTPVLVAVVHWKAAAHYESTEYRIGKS